jgi:hypothetical protein
MDLSLFFAGTAGSVPTARRGLPALLLRRGGERLLFDCGEGTQRQLLRTVGLADVDEVFLTHLHLDHWLGLPGLLKSFDLRDREAPLTVYGPAGTAPLLEGLRRTVIGRLGYPLTIVELEAGESVRHDGYEISAFHVRHRTVAFGYALVEDDRPGRFDADLARELGVADRVELRGQLPPQQALAAARSACAFVLPSVDEAFGVAYVEAMAGGVPAVGCRGEAGPEEIAAAGGGIRLVAPGDVEGLTAELDRLLGDAGWAREQGRTARATVEAAFTWERCGRDTMAAYEAALP